jgi:hypothetical protein
MPPQSHHKATPLCKGFNGAAACYGCIRFFRTSAEERVGRLLKRGAIVDPGAQVGPRVAVVGPDAAGKSTLVKRLTALGYNAHSCAQDHSYVPDMWRRVVRPDFLIFLDAGLETIVQRRRVYWGQERLDALQGRLSHARAHCDLYLPTDDLTPEEVAQKAQTALSAAGIEPGLRE